jgi:hypothetical protein
VELFEEPVLVAVTMGGESTHPALAIKAKFANSSPPQPQLEPRRG